MKEHKIAINGHECTLPIDSEAFTYGEVQGSDIKEIILDLVECVGNENVQLQMEILAWIIRATNSDHKYVTLNEFFCTDDMETKWALSIAKKNIGISLRMPEYAVVCSHASRTLSSRSNT